MINPYNKNILFITKNKAMFFRNEKKMKLKKLKWFTLLGFSGIVAGVAAACANVKQDDGNNVRNQNSTEMGKGGEKQLPGQTQNPKNRNQSEQTPGANTEGKENKKPGENENDKMAQNPKEMQKGKNNQAKSKDNKPETKQFSSTLNVTTLGTETITQQQLQASNDFKFSSKNFEEIKKIIENSKQHPKARSKNNDKEVHDQEIKGINDYLKTLTFNEELLKDYLIAIISNEIQKRPKVSKIELQYSFTDSNNFSFNISIHESLQLEKQLKSFVKKWKSSDQTKYDLIDNGYQFTNVIVDDIEEGANADPASQMGNPIYLDREISGMFFGLSQTNTSNKTK